GGVRPGGLEEAEAGRGHAGRWSVRSGEVVGNHAQRLAGGAGRGEVESVERRGRLGEVDVVVPQTRDGPAAVRVEHLLAGPARQAGRGGTDHAVADPPVDDVVVG